MVENTYKKGYNMHKMVDGKRVELTESQAKVIEAEWAANAIEKKKEKDDKKKEKDNNYQTLRKAGLSNDVIKLLRPELKGLVEDIQFKANGIPLAGRK
jgi:hypothetical protein